MLKKTPSFQVEEIDQAAAENNVAAVFEHLLPDASFLLFGAFSQNGFDLVITNPEGQVVKVPDYFSFPTPPNLVLANGAGLTPSMVKSLFPRSFGSDIQFAGPAPSGGALVEIGSVKLVVGSVKVRHADGSEEAVTKGAVLYQGDVLITGPGSFVKAEMRDGTKFQLGQNGEAALDNFEFDEAQDVGRFEATVRVGGFYYKSGKIGELPGASAQAHTQLVTPTSIIGVRGSELEGAVDESGETVVVHRSGVLEITDINGQNGVVLDTPGNTAVVVINGSPAFTSEPTAQAQQALQQALPPADGSEAEEEAVEAEEAVDEVAEEAVIEAEEAVEEAVEEEAAEEIIEEATEEGEEAAEAEDAEEESEEIDEDLDSLGVEESSVEAVESNEEDLEALAAAEAEVAEASNDETLSTFSIPDTTVESTSDEIDAIPETLQTQDNTVDNQDDALQTLTVNEVAVEETVNQVEETPEETVAEIPPDNPPKLGADQVLVDGVEPLDLTDQLLLNDSDPDPGQNLTIVEVSSDRENAVTISDGRVVFRADEEILASLGEGQTSTEIITYTVQSGELTESTEAVIVYQGAQDAPTAVDDAAATDEDTPIIIEVLRNDFDVDRDDALTIVSIEPVSAEGVIEIAADGQSLLYQPSQQLSTGTFEDLFVYTVSDGVATSTATVTIVIEGINDPPEIVTDPTSFTLVLEPDSGEVSIPLDAIFADPDLGSELTVLSLDTSATQGSVRIGSVLYDAGDAFDYLREGEIGIERFGITVQDEFGQIAEGVYAFQIEGVNDGPVATGDVASVLENGEIALAASDNVLSDDVDAEGDALLVSAVRTGAVSDTGTAGTVGETLTGAYGTLTLNADGSYRYAADAAAVEALPEGTAVEDVFTYTVSDGALTSSAELKITVQGVNDPADLSVTVPDAAVTRNAAYDAIAGGQILLSDVDSGEAALSRVAISGAAYGAVTISDSGAWIYTLDSSNSVVGALTEPETLQDTVTFTSADGSSQTVALTIFTANLPAEITVTLADPDSLTLTAGDRFNEIIIGQVALSDAEGAVLNPITASYGSVSNLDGNWTYTLANDSVAIKGLDDGETLSDAIVFQSDDARDLNADGEVLDVTGSVEGRQVLTVNIIGANDEPIFELVSVNTDQNEDTLSSTVASGVLAFVTDPDNEDGSVTDILEVTGVRTGALGESGTAGTLGDALVGAYGTLILSPDGSYSYVADSAAQDLALEDAAAIDDVFTVEVSDGTAVVSQELRFAIDNVSPVSASGDLVQTVVTTDTDLQLAYLDFDNLSISVDQLDPLPTGFVVATPATADGRTLSISNDGPASSITFSIDLVPQLATPVGDYLLEATVSDGDNTPLSDRFILSVRSEPVLTTVDAIYEFQSGESDYAAVYIDPASNSGSVYVNVWEPTDSSDRLTVFGDVETRVYSTSGATLTVDGAALLTLSDSPGPDVITLRGSISNLSFGGISGSDTLINQTLILASPGANAFQLQNQGIVQLTSSGAGTRDAFDDATAGVVGITRGEPLIIGDATQTVTGEIRLTPDNDPAAPYVVLASLVNDGNIKITGYSGGSISQPSLLEINSGSTFTALIQSDNGRIVLESGGKLSAGSLVNSGVLTLTNNSYDGKVLSGAGLAGHLFVEGSYTEQGVLISNYEGGSLNSLDLNDIHVGSLELTGEIKVQSDLIFNNPAQLLDLRAGTVTFFPGTDMLVAGGEVILGESSSFLGHGGTVVLGETLSGSGATTTVTLDGSVSTTQFQSEFRFESAAVTFNPMSGSESGSLTIGALDALTFDNETVNTDLQVDGRLTVSGGVSSLNGSTQIGEQGLITIVEAADIDQSTHLALGGALSNSGNLTIELVPRSANEISIGYGGIVGVTWDSGVLLIDSTSPHGLVSGDVVSLSGVVSGVYSSLFGEVEVIDGDSFSVLLPDDPGSLSSSGSFSVFDLALTADAGLTNSGNFSITGSNPAVTTIDAYSDEWIYLGGNIVNEAGGALNFLDGQIYVDGDLTNRGTLTIDTAGYDNDGNGSTGGAYVNIEGDLVLGVTSLLRMEIDPNSLSSSLYISNSGGIRGEAATPNDLGALYLEFTDSGIYEVLDGSTAKSFMVLSSVIESADSQFSSVASDLAAGYEVSLQRVASSGTSVETIEVVVTDDMEFESSYYSSSSTSTLTFSDQLISLPQVLAVSDASWSDGVVTLTTLGPHGLLAGDEVYIYDAVSAYSYSGTVTIVDERTVTYSESSAPTFSADTLGNLSVTNYYSDDLTVTAVSWDGGIATVVVAAPHGLTTGQTVSIYSADYSEGESFFGSVTVIDETSVTFSVESDPTSWLVGATMTTPEAGRLDDVRITHALQIQPGESVSLNSLSIETTTTTTSSTTITSTGSLSLYSDSDSVVENASLTLASTSAVAEGSSMNLGSSSSTDTAQLILGDQLTIHGALSMGSSLTVSSAEPGEGKIVVTESGRASIFDGVTLNLTLEISRGGELSWSGYEAGDGISGSGQVENAGAFDVTVYNGVALGVDVINSGVMDLRFGSGSSGDFTVAQDAGVAVVSSGQLLASSFGAGTFILNNNTLDARQGELGLFADSGTNDTYGLTLQGGATAAAPGLIQLQDTMFTAPVRTVALSAAAGGSAGTYTLTATVSDAASSDAYVFVEVAGGTIEGGTSAALSDGTVNSDGSITYTATIVRNSGSSDPITVSVADDTTSNFWFGGELTINSDDTTFFTTNVSGSATLDVAGHVNFELTGWVDFVDANDQASLTLDASSADSIRLSAGTLDAAGLVNAGTLRLNNLTVDAGVALANAPDSQSETGQISVLTISGTSVIDGDLYSLADPYNSASYGDVYLIDSVTVNGEVLLQAGANVTIGYDASSAERATAVLLANDVTNGGNVYIGLGSESHSVTVGSSGAAGTFANEGQLFVYGSSTGTGVVTFDLALMNSGLLEVSGHLQIDATQAGVNHESSGIINLSGTSPTLTLGASDTLLIASGGYLATNGMSSVLVDASASGAKLQIDGVLAIGDTVTQTPDNIFTTAGTGELLVSAGSEVELRAGSTLTIDATFGSGSSLSDRLTVTQASGAGGILRLSGGRLALTSVFSAAGSTATIASAATIVGSFGSVDGLIQSTSGSRTVVNIDQTTTTVTLTPIDASSLNEGSSLGEVFNFDENSITHYLAEAGDDLITGLGFGDTAYGEAGDDVFVLSTETVRRVDGGGGIDQLVLPEVSGDLIFDFRASSGWLGQTFERIEVLNMDDASNQTLKLDELGLRGIVDEASALLDGDLGLVVEGNVGDTIELTGDFEFAEDRYLLTRDVAASGSSTITTYQPELFTGLTNGDVSLFFDQNVLVSVTHSNGGVSQYGNGENNTLTGSALGGETLLGRAGDDVLDGGGGGDRQLGGDGNDILTFDASDLIMDGGNGVDTLNLSGNVDFSGLDQISNLEQLSMAGNGTADTLSVTFEELFDLVGDNSLEAFVPENDHKVIVINGDTEDALIIEGSDVRTQTPIQTGIDLYGDGNSYALFQDATLGLDVYVLSTLLEAEPEPGSEKPTAPVTGLSSLDSYLHEPTLDAFGGF